MKLFTNIHGGQTRLLIATIITLVMSCAISHASEVTLAWDPNDPAPDGYRIFMRLDGQAYNYTSPAWHGVATTATITGLSKTLTYHFVCRAFVGAHESGDSNEVFYTPPGDPPGMVNNITIQKEDGKMFLINDPVDGSTVDYYEVELDGDIVKSDAQRDGDQARVHHELTGIPMGNHTVRIRSVNQWGASGFSDPFVFDAALPSVPSGVGLSAD